MATGNRKVDIYLKKFLTQQQITENFFDYLENKIHDVFTKLFPINGVFEPNILISNILSASAPDSFNIASPLSGTDGPQGNFLVLDPIDGNLIPFENTLGIPYYVGLRFNHLPRETEINVRTGEIKYTFLEEAIGEIADPNSVNDDGDETLTLTVDSVCEPGVSHAGRKVVVWLKRAKNQAQAFEELTVFWDGVNNKIETLTALGQTLGNISTDPSDYQVFLKGPTIRRNTDLRLDNNVLFLGIVTGAGAGNTPNTFDETDVNNHAVSFPSLVSLFFEEHSSVDGTHTLITPERITTKQIVSGVQLDTQVNAADEDFPDAAVAHTLFQSSGGSGIQGIKWRLRNSLGNPIAFIDAHGNAYFQNLAAVTSIFTSSVVVDGDQNVKGSTTLGDDINVDVVTLNAKLQSLTDMIFLIDSDNNGVGHGYQFYNNSVAPLNEVFRVLESGNLWLFGNILAKNPIFNVDLDTDNLGTGETFRITKNGGLQALFEVLETGNLNLFGNLISSQLGGLTLNLDSDNNETGEFFRIRKNGLTTLSEVTEDGDHKALRDQLTGTAQTYKKADLTVIPVNSSLNEVFDETLYRKLLKITPNNPANKSLNVSSGRLTANDGSDFVLPLGQLVSNFSGGTVNFATGAVVGGANFTPINFAGNPNRWAKYSINLLRDNSLLILAGSGFGLTKQAAPNPALARGAIALAVIGVQDDGSAGLGTIQNLTETNIDRLPSAGGSGGDGSGDANAFIQDIKDRLREGFLKRATPVVFEQIQDDLTDTIASNTIFDVANNVYRFVGAGQIFQTIQLYGARFLAQDAINRQIEIWTEWVDVDPDHSVFVSQDGGSTFEQLLISRIGESDRFRGIGVLDTPPAALKHSYSVTNANTTALFNATTSQYRGMRFTVGAGIKRHVLSGNAYIAKSGAPIGELFAEIYADVSGLPDLTNRKATVRIATLTSLLVGNNTIPYSISSILPAADYWLVLRPSDLYRTQFLTSSGVDNIAARSDNTAPTFGIDTKKYNGTTWATDTGFQDVFELSGFDYDLRVKIVSGGFVEQAVAAFTGLVHDVDVDIDLLRHTGITFTPNTSGELKEIDMSLTRILGGTGNLLVDVYAVSADLPVGPPLITSNPIPTSVITNVGGQNPVLTTITFPSGLNLNSGTEYVFAARLDNNTDDIRVNYRFANLNLNSEPVFTIDAGANWSNLARDMNFEVRFMVAGGSTVTTLKAVAAFYHEDLPLSISGLDLQEMVEIDGDDNETEIVLTKFLPDPARMKVYDINSGQVYRYPAFALDGHKVLWATGTFLSPGETIKLLFDQSEGSGFDNSDANAALLAANHLGSTDATISRALAGRGIILMRPDGTLRELALDNNDQPMILSVP